MSNNDEYSLEEIKACLEDLMADGLVKRTWDADAQEYVYDLTPSGVNFAYNCQLENQGRLN